MRPRLQVSKRRLTHAPLNKIDFITPFPSGEGVFLSLGREMLLTITLKRGNLSLRLSGHCNERIEANIPYRSTLRSGSSYFCCREA